MTRTRARADAHDVPVTIFGDDGWTFTAALVDGERWNGWVQPHFTEEVGRQVAAASRRNYDADPEATQEYAEIRETEPPERRFWLVAPGENQEFPVYAHCVDGVWLYAIGAANWTWSLADARR